MGAGSLARGVNTQAFFLSATSNQHRLESLWNIIGSTSAIKSQSKSQPSANLALQQGYNELLCPAKLIMSIPCCHTQAMRRHQHIRRWHVLHIADSQSPLTSDLHRREMQSSLTQCRASLKNVSPERIEKLHLSLCSGGMAPGPDVEFRLYPHEPCSCGQVHVRHIGDMRFKGVPGVHQIVDIALSATAGRQFPTQPPSSKGKVLRPGAGLQYIVERQLRTTS